MSKDSDSLVDKNHCQHGFSTFAADDVFRHKINIKLKCDVQKILMFREIKSRKLLQQICHFVTRVEA